MENVWVDEKLNAGKIIWSSNVGSGNLLCDVTTLWVVVRSFSNNGQLRNWKEVWTSQIWRNLKNDKLGGFDNKIKSTMLGFFKICRLIWAIETTKMAAVRDNSFSLVAQKDTALFFFATHSTTPCKTQPEKSFTQSKKFSFTDWQLSRNVRDQLCKPMIKIQWLDFWSVTRLGYCFFYFYFFCKMLWIIPICANLANQP